MSHLTQQQGSGGRLPEEVQTRTSHENSQLLNYKVFQVNWLPTHPLMIVQHAAQ